MKPPNIDSSALFLKLIETPFPSEVHDFPRKGPDGKPIAQIRLRVLPEEEQKKARLDAIRKAKELDLSQDQATSGMAQAIIDDLAAKEVLARACLMAESSLDDQNGNPVYGRVFVDGDQVGKLTSDEIAVLWSLWQLTQRKFGPLESNVDVDAWVKKLEEGASLVPLVLLSSPDVVELAFKLSEKISLLCKTLATHSETLPELCKSDLIKCYSGIFSAGWRASEPEKPGSVNSPEITIDDAIALAKKLEEK